ncbi:MAG: [Fe-Fe] hydrogenase large subunit C-terminal domain-containing protein [Anaerovoracaceae bacterium]
MMKEEKEKNAALEEQLQASEDMFHSVRLDRDKCMGCTNCIKNCPTQAIRVRNGKAVIISERCIDCGECIRICTHNAKKAVTDSLDLIDEYKYTVALPAPALYSQFKTARTRNHILTALKKIGFDDVFEVAEGAEVISNATRQYIKRSDLKKPVISTACPAIVKLVQIKFPSLIDNLLPLQAPVEAAAGMARRITAEKTGLDPDDIGIFFISPCAAKMHTKNAPLRGTKSDIDVIISFQDIYMKLRAAVKSIPPEEEEDLATASVYGVRWPNPGGEALAADTKKFIAVDGIHDVVEILETIESIEDSKFKDLEFMECLACKGGCLGGPLTVKNVYVAQVIMKEMRSEQNNRYKVNELPHFDIDYHDLLWDRKPEHIPVDKLSSDMSVAFKMLSDMEKINEGLPGIDCGACGAPTCNALAEDIVRGKAKLTDCVFKLREKVRFLANEMYELEGVLPPTMEASGGDTGGPGSQEIETETETSYIFDIKESGIKESSIKESGGPDDGEDGEEEEEPSEALES